MASQAPRRVSFTPPVPDGPDRPWTRGRRTRWWLVPPADLVSVLLVAALVAASVHDLSLMPEMMVHGVVATTAAWLVAWGLTRPQDHLEAADRDGLTVVGTTWLAWLGLRMLSGGDAADVWLVLAAFLLVAQGGWRWVYGYVKAQESLVPKQVQRRLDAQAARDAEEARRSETTQGAQGPQAPDGTPA
ncbi:MULTISPECIES: DUF3054 domain-containing protein [unclassified Actinomyces]|uniref:DUF3054 domain-containing protein n=1 Tax=unclassified Actinomyces TaxID=2609248 RepID=UPI002017256F|nr:MULTISPECIES: DUF3054 domain-containing protein [unclassified Actinomyces]